MTISMMHTMILSSILGDGVMDGPGGLGAAGMAVFGDGITLIAGATGDGGPDGVMVTGEAIIGITAVTPTEVEEAVSAIGSTMESLSEPAIWLMAVIPACPEVHSVDGQTVSLQELHLQGRSEVAMALVSEPTTTFAPTDVTLRQEALILITRAQEASLLPTAV